MKRFVILSAAVLGLSLAGARAAHAQYPSPGTARGLGIGMAGMLNGPLDAGPSGLSVAYDAGAWHLDTLLGLAGGGDRDAQYTIGARGWFHLHQTPGADFSVGGGLGITHYGDRNGNNVDNNDENAVHIDAGFLIRAFLTPHVALSASGGLSLVPGDDAYDGFALNGQLGGFGSFGLHYYFH